MTPISSAASWPLVPTSTARRSPQLPRHTKGVHSVRRHRCAADRVPAAAGGSRIEELHRDPRNLGPTPAQLRYEGNRNLGNTEPGDGRRFAGLFEIQLTGRWNHTAYAKYRGLDVDDLPALADDRATNADVALWYITVNRKGFLAAARRKDVLAASIAVNGANKDTGLPNGYEDRLARTRAVLRVLGIPE